VSARVLAHLGGDDTPERGVAVVTPDPSWIYDAAQERTLGELRRGVADPRAVVVVDGRAGTGRRSAIAHVFGRAVVAIDAERIEPSELDAALTVLGREACLRDTIGVIVDADRISGEAKRRLPALVEGFAGRLAMTSSQGLDLATSRPLIRLRWSAPDVAQRAQLWTRYAGGEIRDVEQLAMRYRVGPGAIARAVASARTLRSDGELDADALSAGLRHNIGERMSGLAERIEVTQRWEDLVLPEDILEQVQALVARIRHSHKVLEQWGFRRKIARGTGVAAMFSGPPGTGKTMVAGLIARELDLEFYQVDLSQIVSKWVGETEKQLARVFDAAEDGHALLLFDEADALFGQRSAEARGATDRYANLEVNFLLQRIEAFGGVTVLTTNLDANVDRALKRRLAAHIVFTIPDEDERALLWERMTSTGSAPLAGDLGFDDLARAFPMMSGANIRNAAFSAAFMAAAEGAAEITQEHLTRAARGEYRSMGHVLADRTMGRSGLARANK
jgi:AAA+ superfamily predicted ATPase